MSYKKDAFWSLHYYSKSILVTNQSLIVAKSSKTEILEKLRATNNKDDSLHN